MPTSKEGDVDNKRIVVGVDGSPPATAAARWAAREAAIRNVELTVMHVVRAALRGWPQTAWPAIPVPAEFGESQVARGRVIAYAFWVSPARTTRRFGGNTHLRRRWWRDHVPKPGHR
jgi:hypothetical protein